MYLVIVLQLCIVYSIQSTAQTDAQACNSCCTAGIPGIPGNHGAVGAPGQMGLKGEQGHTGEQGPRGEQGLKGDVGGNGINGLPGKLGPMGAKGDIGTTGKKGEKGEKGENPTTTTSIVHNKSAFTAVFRKDPGQLPLGPMKYETIITNIGNHYSNITGKFVCVFSGTYVFQVTSLKKDGPNAKIGTHIMKNGAAVVTALMQVDSGYNSISTMAVLQLLPGDEVWTESRSSSDNSYYCNHAYCSFSGFLLYAS